MKKPVFCINRLRHFRTAIFVADAMFALLCLLTVFPIADATDRAAAEVNGDEYSLTVGTNDEVRVSIAPEHDGKMSVMKDSVTTSTNAPTGYKLYISSANTYNSMLLDGEEYNDEDIWAKMTPTEGSFEQPAALFVSDDTPATWGYAIPGLNNFDSEYTTSDPSASSKFAAMPTAGNGQLIRSIDTAIEGDSIDVYYGTKVSSLLRQGKYKIWVNYIAVTEISSEIDNEVSILPRRVRNNYKPGTRITFSSDFRIAPDLGVIQPTVNGLSCDNIIRVSDDPFIFTCELPAGLTNGTYPVSVEIPQLGKHYNAIENLTIVDPYDEMQGVDKEVYDSVMVNDEYQFYDARDDKKYWITKTNDGDLLMTQNLDFAISTEGTVLDPATSNVQNEKTIAASEVPGDGIKDPTKFYYFDAGDYYLDTTIGEQVSSAELDVEAPEWHYHLGSRYSVSTVYTDAVTNTDDADESICPKDWRPITVFPYYRSITEQYGDTYRGKGTINNAASAPLYLINDVTLGGDYGKLVLDGDSVTTYVQNAQDIKNDIEANGAVLGAVRCIYSAPHPYVITYDANGGSGAPERQYYGDWDQNARHRFYLSETIPTREGYKFVGWSTDINATEAEYNPGDMFYATGENTLYAIWKNGYDYFSAAFAAAGKTKLNGYYKMQDMSKSICDIVPVLENHNEANTTQLIDARDNKVYFVSKLKDGNCWMTQNLNYDPTSSDTQDPTLSSVAFTRTIDLTALGQQGFYQSFGNLYLKNGYEPKDITSENLDTNDPAYHYLAGSAYAYQTATLPEESERILNLTTEDTKRLQEIKISHTRNIESDGKNTSAVGPSWSVADIRGSDREPEDYDKAHVVEIEDADKLIVDVYYMLDYYTSYGPLCIWRGSHPEYRVGVDCNNSNIIARLSSYGSSDVYHVLPSGRILYGAYTHKQYEVSGNSVTFAFKTDSSIGSSSYYGYYATVKAKTNISSPITVDKSNYVLSHTFNIDDDGILQGPNNIRGSNEGIVGTNREATGSTDAHVVSVPGAKMLMIDLYYGFDSYGRDGVAIWQGEHPDYSITTNNLEKSDFVTLLNSNYFLYNSDSYNNQDIHTLEGARHEIVYVKGDTATFAQRINNSNNLGYYARIYGVNGDETYLADDIGNSIPKGESATVAYSYTANHNPDGTKKTSYTTNAGNSYVIGTDRSTGNSNAHVVRIENAKELKVTVYYEGESTSFDWACVWAGEEPNFTASSNWSSSISGKLGGPGYTSVTLPSGTVYSGLNVWTQTIEGNAVTFSFKSDGSGAGNGYGYFAIIEATKMERTDEEENQVITKEVFTDSICPKGWRLPAVRKDRNELASIMLEEGTIPAYSFTEQPLYYIGINQPTSYIDNNGLTTIEDGLTDALGVTDNPRNTEGLGFVRCVAADNYPHLITFDARGGSFSYDAIKGMSDSDKPVIVRIPREEPAYPGHKFEGWALDSAATEATVKAGDYFMFTEESLAFYAVWTEINTFEDAFAAEGVPYHSTYGYPMSAMSEKICDILPDVTGDPITTTLYDNRGSSWVTYNVAKLKDGHCWMTQDLKISGSGNTMNQGTSDADAEKSQYIGASSYENLSSYTFDQTTYGDYTGIVSGDDNEVTEVSNSICPINWHLPNTSGDYSYMNLLAAYGNDWNTLNEAFGVTRTAYLRNTAVEQVADNSMFGYWTSGVGNHYDQAYVFAVADGAASMIEVPRNWLFGVRCVAGNVPEEKLLTLQNVGLLQSINQTIISNTPVNTVVSGVRDSRDNGNADAPTYEIGRLSNGKVWMLSSLRYFNANNNYTTSSGIIYTVHLGNNERLIQTPATAYLEDGTTLKEHEEPTYDHSTLGHYYSNMFANMGGGTGSICPVGWYLPSGQDFANILPEGLLESESKNDSAILNGVGGFIRSGYYAIDGDTEDLSEYPEIGLSGYYATSDEDDNYKKKLFYFSGEDVQVDYVNTDNRLFQIRCVTGY